MKKRKSPEEVQSAQVVQCVNSQRMPQSQEPVAGAGKQRVQNYLEKKEEGRRRRRKRGGLPEEEDLALEEGEKALERQSSASQAGIDLQAKGYMFFFFFGNLFANQQ